MTGIWLNIAAANMRSKVNRFNLQYPESEG